jgi:hypothetical protein
MSNTISKGPKQDKPIASLPDGNQFHPATTILGFLERGDLSLLSLSIPSAGATPDTSEMTGPCVVGPTQSTRPQAPALTTRAKAVAGFTLQTALHTG